MPQPWNDVTKATLDVVNHLQRGYLMVPRDAWSVRTMAALRHADAAAPGTDPAVWEVTLGHLPDDLLGRNAAPATGRRSCEPTKEPTWQALRRYSRR